MSMTNLNLRAGIDTKPPDFCLIARINLATDERAKAIEILKLLGDVNREKTKSTRIHGRIYDHCVGESRPQLAVQDLHLNLLVGFGTRFFLGPLDSRGAEEAVPNFPPGGAFKKRIPTRFGITSGVPIYLRTMNASGDKEFLAMRLRQENGA